MVLLVVLNKHSLNDIEPLFDDLTKKDFLRESLGGTSVLTRPLPRLLSPLSLFFQYLPPFTYCLDLCP